MHRLTAPIEKRQVLDASTEKKDPIPQEDKRQLLLGWHEAAIEELMIHDIALSNLELILRRKLTAEEETDVWSFIVCLQCYLLKL